MSGAAAFTHTALASVSLLLFLYLFVHLLLKEMGI
jgi:hypothetical protein